MLPNLHSVLGEAITPLADSPEFWTLAPAIGQGECGSRPTRARIGKDVLVGTPFKLAVMVAVWFDETWEVETLKSAVMTPTGN